MEDKNILSDNTEVAEKLNHFFIEAVQSLLIEPFVSEVAISACERDIIEIIKQYEQHPSIIKIKENVTLEGNFTFTDIVPQDINKHIAWTYKC